MPESSDKENRYQSSSVLKEIVLKEYDLENDRRKNLDIRVGVFIPLVSGLLVFEISNVLSKKLIIPSCMPLLDSIPYWLYIILTVTSLGLLSYSIHLFIKTIEVSEYQRLDLGYYIGGTTKREDLMCQLLCLKYSEAIKKNRLVNDRKVKLFRNGLDYVKYSLAFLIASYIFLFYITNL